MSPADFKSLPTWAWSLDIGLFIVVMAVFIGYGIYWYGPTRKGKSRRRRVNQRDIGIRVIQNELLLVMTACAVLIPGTFITIQVGLTGDNELPSAAVAQLILGAGYLVAAVIGTAWNAGRVSSLFRQHDVSFESGTNLWLMFALTALVVGAFTLVSAFFIGE